MLPNEYTSLETSARTVRDRAAGRSRRFQPPPLWPRGRGPTANKRRTS